ncbi:Peptidase S10, serine carboxypeptidase, active site [Ostreococcus tauri]|uniref:Carboxypeptidase n=1 Tax=Ostreococcus tauri TaxID=70448 RepID=Q00SX3_OSTTA|nr:Peptidase S10, serine carboxypeptidase, active site [Ostreococcus tauri]OUS45220.1 serine carboxypeptidase [Ostreococcus tauri]CAL58491.1 Peptidase S10, serine carboxypeptidase, active site [Ostreococcus tauri]|eukprot:XP_003084075.1 Peptidase S10, serine carboxypeptidase, active site [Ostreococcus tauri]
MGRFRSLTARGLALLSHLTTSSIDAKSVAIEDALLERLTRREIDFSNLKHITEDARDDALIYGASSGTFKLNSTRDAHLFYTFFDRRGSGDGRASMNDSDDESPLIIWLTGGPGCASELASLYENGPYAMERDPKSGEARLGRRAHAWNDAGRLLYVDSPVGTGFSYTSKRADAARDETTVANDLLEFLSAFMLSRPELADVEVYVTGESYAGHYVPAFAHRIFEANKKGDNPVRFNLRGVAIGNGLTEPAIQYGAYADYSLGNDIVDAKAAAEAMKAYPACRKAIKACYRGDAGEKSNRATCIRALNACQIIPETLLENAASRFDGKAINVYDIRKSCDAELCYDFSAAEEWLNRADVQKALGVNKKWEMCDNRVHSDMMGDWMHEYEDMIPPLLEAGIRFMIYAGDQDFICNALGNERWVKAMKWSGRAAFTAEHPRPFVVSTSGDDEIIGGTVTESGKLSFVKVSQAGHMVPMDQPLNALTMIQRFVRGEPIARGDETTPVRGAAPRRAVRDSLRVASQ